MLADLFTAQSLVALLTLTILEIILGIDNVIFIAIVSGSLPEEQRAKAQRLGLGIALISRIALVFGIAWLLRLKRDLFELWGHAFSASDLILVGGGFFLLYKATREIFNATELSDEHAEVTRKGSFAGVIAQILVIDMIFALDSVLTAVGLTEEVALIVIAMTITVLTMLFFAAPLSEFIHRHPSLKILALSFLVLVGVMLFLDGFGRHIERGYIYAAILFSLGVEALNFRRRANLERERGAVAKA